MYAFTRVRRPGAGMTLVELSAALVIFTLTVLTAFGVYYSCARSAQRSADRLRAETWVVARLEECRGVGARDLAHLVPPVAGALGDLPGVEVERRAVPVAGRPGLWEVSAAVRWRGPGQAAEEVRLATWVAGGEE